MRTLLLFALVAFSGCVSTQTVSVASPEDRAYLNDRAERGHPVLALRGERGRQVRGLRIAADSAFWVDKKTGEARVAATSEIEAVTFRRDGRGALKGAAVGAGLGIGLGLLIASGDGGDFGVLDFNLAQGLGLGLLGTVPLSTLVGAIHSDRDVHRVDSRATPFESMSDAGVAEMSCIVPMSCAVPGTHLAHMSAR